MPDRIAISPESSQTMLFEQWIIQPEGTMERWKNRSKRDERTPVMQHLISLADAALSEDSFTVTRKDTRPPSGDKHDYMSLGTYWWPDPQQPNGLPYIRKDGETNPQSQTGDLAEIRNMCFAVMALLLAWSVTKRQEYVEKAATLSRAFFFDPETRMNPHLQYAQAIPGRLDGRGIGIIDTKCLVPLLDVIPLLNTWSAWTDTDRQQLQDWFTVYLNWLLTSDHGKTEKSEKNNHGTWYDVQVLSFAIFTQQNSLAHQIAQSAPARLDGQIASDGRQPHELKRSRSLSYCIMNLIGWACLVRLARFVGINLWDYRNPTGVKIQNAIDFLVPYAGREEAWPYMEIGPLFPAPILVLLRFAEIETEELCYTEAIHAYPDDQTENHSSSILLN